MGYMSPFLNCYKLLKMPWWSWEAQPGIMTRQDQIALTPLFHTWDNFLFGLMVYLQQTIYMYTIVYTYTCIWKNLCIYIYTLLPDFCLAIGITLMRWLLLLVSVIMCYFCFSYRLSFLSPRFRTQESEAELQLMRLRLTESFQSSTVACVFFPRMISYKDPQL